MLNNIFPILTAHYQQVTKKFTDLVAVMTKQMLAISLSKPTSSLLHAEV